MAEIKPLYSTCVAVLGFICFVVGATAVGIPMWGYFSTPQGEFDFNFDMTMRRMLRTLILRGAMYKSVCTITGHIYSNRKSSRVLLKGRHAGPS